ncbi:hypothetical protein EDD21DRAFT_388095, partial [Dissophora ornata]
MKNLFRVLLIATFAIASSVAIQEVLQAGVAGAEASTLDSPSPATIVEEALWHKKHKHHHHHHKQCRNNIITLPFPECEHECEEKCKFGGLECGEECKVFERDCKDKCKKPTIDCKDKCEDSNSRCNLRCDDQAVGLCIQILEGFGETQEKMDSRECGKVFSCKDRCLETFKWSPGHEEYCDKVCGSNDCAETCNALVSSGELHSDEFAPCEKVCVHCVEKCEKTFISQGLGQPLITLVTGICKIECEIQERCKRECKGADKACDDACDTCDKECNTACDTGKDWCKGKCEHGVQKCNERCKPCKVECNKACHEDEKVCFSDCKNFIGSEQDCKSKCERNCGSVCERRCKRCDADTDDDADIDDGNDEALEGAAAPEEEPTIAAVS